jgi:hypothetical protein
VLATLRTVWPTASSWLNFRRVALKPLLPRVSMRTARLPAMASSTVSAACGRFLMHVHHWPDSAHQLPSGVKMGVVVTLWRPPSQRPLLRVFSVFSRDTAPSGSA